MSANVLIRAEVAGDVQAIEKVTIAAFESLDVSNQTEHFIVQALRDAGVLSLSLVAVVESRVVGHIAFSPVALSDGTKGWYGLGPVSVLPSFQGQGIGTALVDEGLSRLKAKGACGCYVVGHPAYYTRFGFKNASELTLHGVPPEVCFARIFSGDVPKGIITFHEAFMADGSGDSTPRQDRDV